MVPTCVDPGATPGVTYGQFVINKGTEAAPRTLLIGKAVVSMGQKSLAHVICLLSALPGVISDNPSITALAKPWQELQPLSLPSNANKLIFHDEAVGYIAVRVPIMLLLAGPLCLPPGVLSAPSLGHAGLQVLLAWEGLQLSKELCARLNDPLTKAWLAVAAICPEQ